MRDGLKSFLGGLKTSVPVMMGFIPVAIAFAIMATSAGLDGFESVAMSVMVYVSRYRGCDLHNEFQTFYYEHLRF